MTHHETCKITVNLEVAVRAWIMLNKGTSRIKPSFWSIIFNNYTCCNIDNNLPVQRSKNASSGFNVLSKIEARTNSITE